VPYWAIDGLCQAKAAVCEAAEVEDLADTYQKQLEAAERDGVRINREAVLELLLQCDNVCEKLQQLLPLVRKAREVFDNPESAKHMREPQLPQKSILESVEGILEGRREMRERILESAEIAEESTGRVQELYHRVEPTVKSSVARAVEYAVDFWDWGAAALDKAAKATPHRASHQNQSNGCHVALQADEASNGEPLENELTAEQLSRFLAAAQGLHARATQELSRPPTTEVVEESRMAHEWPDSKHGIFQSRLPAEQMTLEQMDPVVVNHEAR
jgi:hypothetical protein